MAVVGMATFVLPLSAQAGGEGNRVDVPVGQGRLSVLVKAGEIQGAVSLDGIPMGSTPLNLSLAPGCLKVEVRFPFTTKPFSQDICIVSQKTLTIYASRVFSVGEKGPAGGIIFHDKGYYSDGWRWLEAAPEDLSASIHWHKGKARSIDTSSFLGSGKVNTQAIIKAFGKGSYAARLCHDYQLGEFADWFLPSKDELKLLYENLGKSGLGGLSSLSYWSSSQGSYGDDYAWRQKFDGGVQENDNQEHSNAVRACRAF